MNKYTFFFKLLIILLLLCILIKIITNYTKENYQSESKCFDVEKNSYYLPNPVKLNLSVNEEKNQINFNWKPDSIDKKIIKYIIIMYKNDKGPYLLFPNIDNELDSNVNQTYSFSNPSFNIRYKFAVVGVNEYGQGPIENYNEVYITFDNVEFNMNKDLKTQIICSADGEHIISDSCSSDNIDDVTALSQVNPQMYFDEQQHNELMNILEDKNKIKLNFNIL